MVYSLDRMTLQVDASSYITVIIRWEHKRQQQPKIISKSNLIELSSEKCVILKRILFVNFLEIKTAMINFKI